MKDVVTHKRIIIFARQNGKDPFTEWVYGLRDVMGRKRILHRPHRLEHGNYGDCEPVGEGIYELRMFFGSGYRVYFGEQGSNLVVILCAGDKSSQSRDIEQAKTYWREFLTYDKL